MCCALLLVSHFSEWEMEEGQSLQKTGEKVVEVEGLESEEVVKHNKEGDCWLIISGKVYDVTSFLDQEHPGGDEVIIMASGKDATADFENVGHSSDAREKLKELYIGDIDESTLPVKQQFAPPPPPPAPKQHEESGNLSKGLLYILPFFILGVAFLFRFYSKPE